MKQIIVIPQGEQYAKYVEIGLLIDQTYAMTLGEEHVHLVKIKPTTRTDIYIAEQPYSFVTIAVGTYGIEDLPIILKKLKSISGWNTMNIRSSKYLYLTKKCTRNLMIGAVIMGLLLIIQLYSGIISRTK